MITWVLAAFLSSPSVAADAPLVDAALRAEHERRVEFVDSQRAENLKQVSEVEAKLTAELAAYRRHADAPLLALAERALYFKAHPKSRRNSEKATLSRGESGHSKRSGSGRIL